MAESTNFNNTLAKLIDYLGGKEADLKLTFHDLTFELGSMKGVIDGSAVIDLSFAITKKVGDDLQLPSWLSNIFKRGDIAVSIDRQKTLAFIVENKKVNIDIVDKQFVKRVLAEFGGGRTSLLSSLSQLRSIAEELRKQELTIIISYKNGSVVTVGVNAKPKYSRLVTGTSAVEINNLFKLLELAL